jgi:hypothetical protein
MPTLSRLRLALLAVSTAAILTLSACGSFGATPSTQAGAEGALCANLTALGDSVEAFIALEVSSASMEDVEAARDEVADAWATVKESTDAIEDADEAALEAAWGALQQSITDMPTDVPISEALGAVRASAQGVRTAYQEIRDGVDCQ